MGLISRYSSISDLIAECRRGGVSRVHLRDPDGSEVGMDLYPAPEARSEALAGPPGIDLGTPSADPLTDPATSGYNLVGFARTTGVAGLPRDGEEE